MIVLSHDLTKYNILHDVSENRFSGIVHSRYRIISIYYAAETMAYFYTIFSSNPYVILVDRYTYLMVGNTITVDIERSNLKDYFDNLNAFMIVFTINAKNGDLFEIQYCLTSDLEIQLYESTLTSYCRSTIIDSILSKLN